MNSTLVSFSLLISEPITRVMAYARFSMFLFLLGTNLVFRCSATGRSFLEGREMCCCASCHDSDTPSNDTATSGLRDVGDSSKAELSFPGIY